MKSEWRRMSTGRGFWLSVVLCVAGLLAGITWPSEVQPSGTFFTMVQKAFCAKPVCYLLPVIAVLPWSDSFLREWKSGYLKAALPRIGRRAYVEIKILTVAGGGILAVWLAAIVVTFGSFLVCFPQEKAGSIAAEPVQMLAATVLRCSLVGASFASLGGICGILGGSADMAFGIPLVVYYFCMILKERYFPDALWLYPPQWISGAARWGERGEGLWLFLLLMLAVLMGGHAATIYGKIEAG